MKMLGYQYLLFWNYAAYFNKVIVFFLKSSYPLQPLFCLSTCFVFFWWLSTIIGFNLFFFVHKSSEEDHQSLHTLGLFLMKGPLYVFWYSCNDLLIFSPKSIWSILNLIVVCRSCSIVQNLIVNYYLMVSYPQQCIN